MNEWTKTAAFYASSYAGQINKLATLVAEGNREAGFWDEPVRPNAECFALMHSEISEALEADRKDLMDSHIPSRKGIEVEMADTVIRILDFCGYHGLDLGGAIADKLGYNAQRPPKHGKKY